MPSQRPLELRAIPALALLLIAISWVVANAGRGFGLTDESFYLWWSARPGDFAAMIQPFGPPLHLLFEAAGETVPGFRLAGLAFLLGAGAILGLALAGPVRAARPSIGTSTVVIVTMTAMLANYAQWVITPNYNQLTSIAAALCLAGLLWWAERRDKAILASALIGVSGALVLFAKPTAAVISALAALAILGWRMRAIGTATTIIRAAIAGLAALATLGAVLEATVGVGAFIRSLQLGLKILNFGNSPSALPLKVVGELVRPPVEVLVGALILLLALAIRARLLARVGSFELRLAFGAILLLAATGLAITFATGTPLGQRLGPLTLMAACAALAMLIAAGRNPMSKQGALLAGLLLLPFALSIGTTNPIYWQTGVYLWPWLLLIVLVCWTDAPLARLRPEPVLGVTVCLLLAWGSFRPYGLAAPIWAQRVSVTIPFTAGTVAMEPRAADYANRLRAVGQAAGIDRDTPVIDLSSGGPGTTLFLGGRSPVFPWLVGIYATSAQTADSVWRLVPKDRRRAAWFIGPPHPNLAHSAPARWLNQRRSSFRLAGRLRGQFGAEYPIEIWAPIASVQPPGNPSPRL